MVPPPSSIVTNAEFLRLELLRSASRARLAAPASRQGLSGHLIPTVRRIVPLVVRRMLAPLRLQLGVRPLRSA